jgi:hypothetical protein
VPTEEQPPPEAPKKAPKGKRQPIVQAPGPGTVAAPTSLLPRAAPPEDLEAIRLMCLEKEIDLKLILEKWQVSQLEELDGARALQVQEWLKGQ